MPQQPNSSHFHAGKAARKDGKACFISDGRMKPESREQWYAGWNYQNNAMLPQAEQAVVEQNESFFATLRAELRAAANQPTAAH
ncbi:MAG: hypothetical protein ACO1TE_27075 [Prosthecobacter sp.]